MLALIKYEALKLLQNKKCLLILVVMIIVYMLLFIYQQSLSSIPSSSYQRLQETLDSIDNEQRYTYIHNEYKKYQAFEILEQLSYLRQNESENQMMIESILSENPNIEKEYLALYRQNHQLHYTDSLEAEVQFLKGINDEMTLLHQYPQYIQQIQEKAQTFSQISIFQQDSQTQNDIQKSAQDYQGREDIDIIYESEYGIQQSLTFPMTSLFLFIMIFLLSSTILIEERESGCLGFMKTTVKGSTLSIIAKMVVLIVGIGLICIFIYSSLLFYMAYQCGLGDLSKSIQSLASYYQCPLRINVIQFMALFLSLKIISLSFIGLLMMIFCLTFKNQTILWITMFLIVLIEYVFYIFIPHTSSFSIIKYLNIVALLQTHLFFGIYQNISVFGQLMSLYSLIWIIVLCAFMMSAGICYRIFICPRDLTIMTSKHTTFTPVFTSLRQFEFYKILILQKGWFVIVLCLFLQLYNNQHTSLYTDYDTTLYLQYLTQVEGPLTEEKESWILKQQAYFQDLHQQLDQISQQNLPLQQRQKQQELIENKLVGENAFLKIVEQYEWIQEHPQAQFIFSLPYENYLLSDTWMMTPMFVLCLFIIICLFQVISYEYQFQTHYITLSTLYGQKKVIMQKIICSLVITLVLCLLIFGTTFLIFQQKYGFHHLDASALSIPELVCLPSWLHLGVLMIIDFLLKIIAAICLVMILLALGLYFKNAMLTLLVSLFVFVLPLSLVIMDISWIKVLSLYPLFCSVYCFIQEPMILAMSMILWVGLALYSAKYLRMHYRA